MGTIKNDKRIKLLEEVAGFHLRPLFIFKKLRIIKAYNTAYRGCYSASQKSYTTISHGAYCKSQHPAQNV